LDTDEVRPLSGLEEVEPMRQQKNSDRTIAASRQLDKLIEEATVHCYYEEEQASGFFMIDENLALPFRTSILGIEV